MRTSTFVIAALIGASSASISQKQRDTVAELTRKINAGDLENLMTPDVASPVVLSTIHID